MTSATYRSFAIIAALAICTTGCELIASVDRDLITDPTGGAGGDVPRPRGVLGGFDDDEGQIYGWAVGTDETAAVTVRIEIDGLEAGTVSANSFRQDLIDKESHPTGNAGFRFDMPTLMNGAEVRAFIDDLDQELTGSPFTASGLGGGGGMGGMGMGGMGGAGGAGGS